MDSNIVACCVTTTALAAAASPTLAAGFLSGDLKDRIEARIEEELLGFIEGLASQLHGDLAANLDIRTMVQEKIEGFDLERLESIIQHIAAKELRHIVILGGVLGFLVGLAEVGLLWLLP